MAGKTPIYEPLAAGDNDDWDIPVADMSQLSGGIKVFNNNADRDAWAKKYPSRLPNTIALVGNGENNYPSWYKWETTWHFAGYFGGMVIADTDGALTRVDSTAVLGPDFQIQAAGDDGNGVLIMLSDKAKADIAKHGSGSAWEIAQAYGNYDTVDNVTSLNLYYPLEVHQGKSGPGKVSPGYAMIGIKPGAYEAHRGEARLAYFDMDEVILGKMVSDKRKGAIWADKVAFGQGNVDIYADRPTKSVVLQDPYDDDPSVSGGAAMLCALHLSFYGKAPDDGQIEIYRVDSMTGNVLENASNQPMGFIHHYKSGDKIEPITIAQVYMAKGAVKAQWCVKHTFKDDPIRMKDWDVGSSCMLDMYVDKESVSPALNEFQSVIGKPVRVMRKYYGSDAFSNTWEYGFDVAQFDADANQGQDSVLGIDFENPTKLKVAMQSSVLNIKDVNNELAYFNTGIELSEEDTVNLRGRPITVSLDAFTRYNALNLGMFVYTGNMADITRPIVTGFSNSQPTLSAGWDLHDHGFLAEHPEGNFHPLSKGFVIPTQAKIVMFGVYPSEEQSPMDISLKPMTIEVNTPFTAYESTIGVGDDVLYWGHKTSSFITQPGKIWKLDVNKTNLPLGEKVQKTNDASVKLSVEEDDANAYKGGLELGSVSEYVIEVWLNVSNYYKVDIPSREEIQFTVEDGEGFVSEAPELVLTKGDFNQHLVRWTFSYDNKAVGTVLKLYGSAPVDGSAFISTGTYNAAGIVVNEKVAP